MPVNENEIVCFSPPLNRRGKAAILAAALGLLIPLGLRLSGLSPRLLWEGLAFAFGCVFLWMSLRYLFVRYRYEIAEAENGKEYLYVTSTQGRRATQLARLPLDCLCAVSFVTPAEEKAAKKNGTHAAPLHRYHAQLFPQRLLSLVFDSEGEIIRVQLDADEPFAAALKGRLPVSEG